MGESILSAVNDDFDNFCFARWLSDWQQLCQKQNRNQTGIASRLLTKAYVNTTNSFRRSRQTMRGVSAHRSATLFVTWFCDSWCLCQNDSPGSLFKLMTLRPYPLASGTLRSSLTKELDLELASSRRHRDCQDSIDEPFRKQIGTRENRRTASPPAPRTMRDTSWDETVAIAAGRFIGDRFDFKRQRPRCRGTLASSRVLNRDGGFAPTTGRVLGAGVQLQPLGNDQSFW